MKKNTEKVWDSVWADPHLQSNHKLIVAAEEQTIRWQKISNIVNRELGGFNGLSVLEIGSGTGTYAALMAKHGADVTLLDYSPIALERAQIFFKSLGLKARFVKGDAFALPTEVTKKKFDIAISIGLTEHFKGRKRVEINKVHLDVLKKGGLAIISVPNTYNPPYFVYKIISTWLGSWKFGEEYSYTRSELLAIAKMIRGKVLALFGDGLYSSFKFILPANFLRRFFGVGFPRNFLEIRKEIASPLDDYLSYSLILVLKKP
ncbi:MAG: hypothetical protein QG639_121 [Patescibacteria group bacterium]|nr:hypothetical protein [Patescibacteria group bacterium]